MKEIRFKSTVFLIMASVLLSRIMGFVRTALIPVKMGGLSRVTDAYNAAFQVPDLMYSMLIGGAIASSLIPVLAGYVAKGEEKKGWRSVSSFMNLVSIIMFVVVILCVIFAKPLVNMLVPGYDAETLELTVQLTKILMPIAFFMMLAGLCNGIMNSYNEFIIPAFGPCLYNLACIISIALFSNDNVADNYGVKKVVLGIVICAGLYFLFQFAFTFKHFKNNYTTVIAYKEPDFKLLIALAIPSLLTSMLGQISLIISRYFTAFFDVGSVTALELVNKTWQMPLGIIAQAIGIAMLPSLAAVYDADKKSEVVYKINTSLRLVIFLAIPSAIGLSVLSKPLIQVLFNYGTIEQEGITLAANLLIGYSLALVMQCIITIVNRVYFSTKNSIIPFWGSLIGVVFNYLIAYLLLKLTDAGIFSVPVAYSLSSVLNLVFLGLLFKTRIKGYTFRDNIPTILKSLMSAIMMGAAIYLLDILLMPAIFGTVIIQLGKIKQFLWILIEIGIGAGIYMLFTYLMKADQARELIDMVRAKFKSITGNN
ncbi:MAG TPA: murein biosynthesis integral membrane protein MurJ [Clostridia bacterium]|nr:murein biosynthesis integral membrane protein MurJ [Clostridia bacterium]HPL08266.1 murein biosynthesis integral membrane protein MurJ [Clostridia bacterium]